MNAAPRAGCHAFEQDLLLRLEESGPDAPVSAEGHPVECAGCRGLVALLNGAAATLGILAPPRPSVRLLRTLSAPPADFAAHRAEIDERLRAAFAALERERSKP